MCMHEKFAIAGGARRNTLNRFQPFKAQTEKVSRDARDRFLVKPRVCHQPAFFHSLAPRLKLRLNQHQVLRRAALLARAEREESW